MNNGLRSDPQLIERWDAIVEPGWEVSESAFRRLHDYVWAKRNVLNCAVPLARARQLADFHMPVGCPDPV